MLVLLHTVYECGGEQPVAISHFKHHLIIVACGKGADARSRLILIGGSMKSSPSSARFDGFIITDDLERGRYIFVFIAGSLDT
jgi:hypothetical protein